MYKIKSKITKDGSKVIVKLGRDELFNNREVSFISQTHSANLMRVTKSKKNLIEYLASQSISLANFMLSPHTKHEFYLIVEQMICFFKNLQKTELTENNLLLDFRYVFINSQTKEISFLYLPIVSNHVLVDVKSFFDSVANMYTPMQGERIDYLQQFRQFLKKSNVLDLNATENFVLSQDKTVKEEVRRITVSQSGFITDKKQELLDYRRSPQDIPQDSFASVQDDFDEATGLLEDDSDEGTILLQDPNSFDDDEGTTLLNNQDDEGTTLLDGGYNSFAHFPTLTRIKNNEVITINKPVFRLGKVRDFVDYFVNDNSAISRSHADIVTRGNRYFVSDQNSTNHTFINGIVLPPIQETEIYDGDTLKLADEEFIFNI